MWDSQSSGMECGATGRASLQPVFCAPVLPAPTLPQKFQSTLTSSVPCRQAPDAHSSGLGFSRGAGGGVQSLLSGQLQGICSYNSWKQLKLIWQRFWAPGFVECGLIDFRRSQRATSGHIPLFLQGLCPQGRGTAEGRPERVSLC